MLDEEEYADNPGVTKRDIPVIDVANFGIFLEDNSTGVVDSEGVKYDIDIGSEIVPRSSLDETKFEEDKDWELDIEVASTSIGCFSDPVNDVVSLDPKDTWM